MTRVLLTVALLPALAGLVAWLAGDDRHRTRWAVTTGALVVTLVAAVLVAVDQPSYQLRWSSSGLSLHLAVDGTARAPLVLVPLVGLAVVTYAAGTRSATWRRPPGGAAGRLRRGHGAVAHGRRLLEPAHRMGAGGADVVGADRPRLADRRPITGGARLRLHQVRRPRAARRRRCGLRRDRASSASLPFRVPAAGSAHVGGRRRARGRGGQVGTGRRSRRGCSRRWLVRRRCRRCCTRPPWSPPAPTCWPGCNPFSSTVAWFATSHHHGRADHRSERRDRGRSCSPRPSKLLAASTSAQYGLMLVAVGSGYPTVAIAHLVAHGLFKALLFVSAGVAIDAAGTHEPGQHAPGRADAG